MAAGVPAAVARVGYAAVLEATDLVAARTIALIKATLSGAECLFKLRARAIKETACAACRSAGPYREREVAGLPRGPLNQDVILDACLGAEVDDR